MRGKPDKLGCVACIATWSFWQEKQANLQLERRLAVGVPVFEDLRVRVTHAFAFGVANVRVLAAALPVLPAEAAERQ